MGLSAILNKPDVNVHMTKSKKIASKAKRFELMKEAVNAALGLFPEIERWAFGEGGIVTPALQRKFDAVKKQLEYAKTAPMKTGNAWVTPEMRKARSDRMFAYHERKAALNTTRESGDKEER